MTTQPSYSTGLSSATPHPYSSTRSVSIWPPNKTKTKNKKQKTNNKQQKQTTKTNNNYFPTWRTLINNAISSFNCFNSLSCCSCNAIWRLVVLSCTSDIIAFVSSTLCFKSTTSCFNNWFSCNNCLHCFPFSSAWSFLQQTQKSQKTKNSLYPVKACTDHCKISFPDKSADCFSKCNNWLSGMALWGSW